MKLHGMKYSGGKQSKVERSKKLQERRQPEAQWRNYKLALTHGSYIILRVTDFVRVTSTKAIAGVDYSGEWEIGVMIYKNHPLIQTQNTIKNRWLCTTLSDISGKCGNAISVTTKFNLFCDEKMCMITVFFCVILVSPSRTASEDTRKKISARCQFLLTGWSLFFWSAFVDFKKNTTNVPSSFVPRTTLKEHVYWL